MWNRSTRGMSPAEAGDVRHCHPPRWISSLFVGAGSAGQSRVVGHAERCGEGMSMGAACGGRAVLMIALVSCMVGELAAGERTERFDRDPDWDGQNNRAKSPEPR